MNLEYVRNIIYSLLIALIFSDIGRRIRMYNESHIILSVR